MHKYACVALLWVSSAWAQIPERNCMSNPMMAGCPAAEQARKTQEMMSKHAWENLPGMPGSSQPAQQVSGPQPTPQPRTATPAANRAAADSDWKRPRLAAALPANWPRWNFAPPDSGALIGMKLSALIQSPVFAALLGDSADALRTSPVPADEVWVSITTGPKPESVMLFVGPGVESIATELRSKGVTVCFLDRQSVLAGEWSSVNRALQRVSAGVPGPFAKRAAELWAHDDLWILTGPQMSAQVVPASAKGVTGASLGMSFQNKISAEMLLNSATPAETAKLAGKLRENPADLGLGEATVESTARGVLVKASLDAAQLPESLRNQIAEQVRPLLGSQAQASSNKIVIQGLDDGPKTISVK